MDPIKKTVVSKEEVVLPVPPNREELSKMDHSEKESGDSELMIKAMSLGVNRSQVEGINDIDKQKKFLIEEILRLDPPFPRPTQPVLVDTNYHIEEMNKTVTYKYVKHITIGGKYSHSIISNEKYKEAMSNHELDIIAKNHVEDSITNEIKNLNIDDYINNKNNIIKFACDNAKSNTEKKKRMIMLQNYLKSINSDCKHYRIINQEIASY